MKSDLVALSINGENEFWLKAKIGLIQEDYRKDIFEFYQKQITNKESKLSYREFPINIRNGDVVWIGQMVRIKYFDNNDLKIIAVAWDISNSVKFTHKGSIQLNLKLEEDKENTCKISFEIVDTGIGISSDKIKNVFSPYVQAEMHTSREYGGSGLGLTITRRLLRKMGSDIFVESQIDQGSILL